MHNIAFIKLQLEWMVLQIQNTAHLTIISLLCTYLKGS